MRFWGIFLLFFLFSCSHSSKRNDTELHPSCRALRKSSVRGKISLQYQSSKEQLSAPAWLNSPDSHSAEISFFDPFGGEIGAILLLDKSPFFEYRPKSWILPVWLKKYLNHQNLEVRSRELISAFRGVGPCGVWVPVDIYPRTVDFPQKWTLREQDMVLKVKYRSLEADGS